MRAAIIMEIGQPLVLQELRDPEPKSREVLIKVTACGVCHTDLHVMKGDVKFPIPAVLGHEVSGVVEALGPQVSGLKVGEPVVCSFIMPCEKCHYCLQGRDNLCINFFKYNRLQGKLYDDSTRLFDGDGTPVWMYSMGGHAQYAVVPVGGVFPLPPSIPLDKACILGCAVFTAYGAVKNQAKVSPGDSVAVFAVGGVGTNLVQMAKAFGATEIIAVDIREDKLELARSIGSSHTVNGSREDVPARIREITGGRGVDVAIEALGLPQTILQAYSSVADGGRVVMVGISPKTVPIDITRTVRRGITIVGSFGAHPRTDMPAVIRLVENRSIDVNKAVSRTYTLDQVNEAYDALERGQIVGRSIISLE